MTRIFKYPLLALYKCEIMMPEGAKVICVQIQNDQPVIYALIDDTKPLRNRQFRIVRTGHTIDFDMEGYIGTFQVLGGGLVFHIFEV